MPSQFVPRDESLRELLGGRRAAVDASLPPAVFVLVWLMTRSVGWAAGAAVLAGLVAGGYRMWRGQGFVAVALSVAAVALAGYVAVRTGRAEDFFLLQLLSNMASALLWMVSIGIRWPLLGVVVGLLLGQRTRWRRDPDLLRAYSLASWVWVAQYVLRVAVFGLLWWSGWVVALGVARIALSWPLVAAVVALSAVVFRRALPSDHPGMRRPRTPDEPVDEPAVEQSDAGRA